MFETRIRIVLVGLALIGLVMVGRLFQLQILHNQTYAAEARRVLMNDVRYLPFVRGSIRTADGKVLASDQPSWDICLHYGMLSGDERSLKGLIAEALVPAGRRNPKVLPEQREKIFGKLNETWTILARIGGMSRQELLARRDAICQVVQRVQEDVSRRCGFDQRISEEFMAHPMVCGLNDQEQIDVRQLFKGMPWVEVRPSTRRVYTKNRTFAHLLGRMGAVTREVIDKHPTLRGDPDRRYLPGEMVGVAGLEKMFESALRGKRGRFRTDRQGNTLSRVEPVDGTDLVLTLDYRLQTEVFDILARHVNERALPGGAAVILHVPTRSVRALASFPSFDPNRLREPAYYKAQRNNTHALPLLFRAVNGLYAPGSIVKPVAVLAALADNAITLEATVDCRGYLFPNQPMRWREWRDHVSRIPVHHGLMNAERAIKQSCNVFCYHLADKVELETFCYWFSQFGLGRPAGTGLAEDVAGTLPTPERIRGNGRTPSIADARFATIGQGLRLTPLQAANMFATIASAKYKPVALVRDDGIDRPSVPIEGIRPEHFNAVRKGLYRAVNEPGGTAYRTANLHRDDFVLLGKTGSAQCSRRVLACDVKFQINDQPPQWKTMRITYPQGAASKLAMEYRPGTRIKILESKIRELWPVPNDPEQASPSHAWFAGYVLPKSAPVDQVPEHVFVVLMEFGGSGGRVAAPVGKDIAELLIARRSTPVARANVTSTVGGRW